MTGKERFIEIYPDAYIDNDGYFVVEDEDGKKFVNLYVDNH